MELTARNQVRGTVVSVTRAPVSALVKIHIGGDQYITATVTTEAVDQFRLTEGAEVVAVFKASSVMLGLQ